MFKILYYVLVGPPLPERQLQTAMTFAVCVYIILYTLHRFTFVRVVWCMYAYNTYIKHFFFFYILIITIRNP